MQALHISMGTHTHTHTHRGMDKWTDIISSFLMGCAPPLLKPSPPSDQTRLEPLCTTSGNSGPCTTKTPEGGPSTLTMPLHCGVGTRSPTCTSVELRIASGLVLPQPEPGSQFTILFGPGGERKIFLFFSCGKWWDLNL